ncbi:MAG: EipB family protein [Alphaproteobacteria bacterium]
MPLLPRSTPGLLALAMVVLWMAPAAVAHAVELAPHRAVYELRMTTVEPSSGVVGGHGAMSLDWTLSCTGWTVNQRLRLMLQPEAGPLLDTEVSFSSFESGDGLRYRFSSRTMRNGQVVDEFRGRAERSEIGAPGIANYSVPEGAEQDLPAGTVFPMEHTRLLLEAAEQGERRLFRRLFDGPRPSESPFDANALILGGPHADESGPGSGMGPITEHRWWPIRIAFFPRSAAEAEPDFELAARLQDNGVVRQFVFDYGDFEMTADLARIEELESPDCAS